MYSSDNSHPPRKVSVFGLGYVGLTLAAVLADAGFDVEGVEVRGEVVEGLRQGKPHFHEPGLPEMLKRVVRRGCLRVGTALPEDSRANVHIITVGTPLGPQGAVRLDMIERVADEISVRLRPGDLVIARSTVRLGTTRSVIGPILDRAGIPYDIAYCPERTVEGQALKELRWLPQIIGAETASARVASAALFNAITPTVIQLPNLEAAEMVKLIDNTYRDVTFAFANEVARLCDAVGIDVIDVISAGKFGYPRTSVPLPGPVGGPCLEKDPHILAQSLRPFGVTPDIALAARRGNEAQPADLVARLKKRTDTIPGWPEKPVIGLLGLAFKGRPANSDLRGSMAIPLLAELRRAYPQAEFRGFDPVVPADEIERSFVMPAMPDIGRAAAGANLLMIANNHPCFEAAGWEERAGELGRPALIYDLWNQARARDLELPDGVVYIGLGDGRLPV